MTYREIAARYSLRVCAGCAGPINHEQGTHTVDGKIHWRERRVTKLGLRRFLKLAMSVILGLRDMPEPEKTYWMSVGAADLAAQIGYRFPRSYADLDRARVRAALVNANLDKETRMMITRWAR